MAREKSSLLIKKYDELGDQIAKFEAYIPIIDISTKTVLEAGEQIEDENKRLRFYGGNYLELIGYLRKAGIITN